MRITLIPCIAAVWYLSSCDGSAASPAAPGSRASKLAALNISTLNGVAVSEALPNQQTRTRTFPWSAR